MMLYYKLIIVFLLLPFFKVSAQITWTPDEVEAAYGSNFEAKQFEDGTFTMLYLNPVNTKTSGPYTQQKIMYFSKSEDGNFYCYKFQLIEPASETAVNRYIYDHTTDILSKDKWRDPGNGVLYHLMEEGDFCIITAWLERTQDERKKEVPVSHKS